jgi:ABC-type Na+ transport system ATPase subunit NatA
MNEDISSIMRRANNDREREQRTTSRQTQKLNERITMLWGYINTIGVKEEDPNIGKTLTELEGLISTRILNNKQRGDEQKLEQIRNMLTNYRKKRDRQNRPTKKQKITVATALLKTLM